MSHEEVLEFWFGDPPKDGAEVSAKVVRWFRGGEAMDREVVARFRAAVEHAVRGGFEEWRVTPGSRLALVLLLDQLTRNVFRDSPRMFDGDERAQGLTVESFDDGHAALLSWPERVFLSMPLLHSESVPLHELDLEIARGLAAQVESPYESMAAMRLEQAGKYLDVVRRFGRFPHRNALLGRPSTRDELEFLNDWEAKRPPAGMPEK